MSARRRRTSLGVRIMRAFTRGAGRTAKDMGRELVPLFLRRKRKGKGRKGSAWQTQTARRTKVSKRGGGGLTGGNPRVDSALIQSGWGPVRSTPPVAPRARNRAQDAEPGWMSGQGPSLFSREASAERQRWRAGQAPAWQRHGMPDPEGFEQRAQEWDAEARAAHGVEDADDLDDGTDPDDPSSAAGGAV